MMSGLPSPIIWGILAGAVGLMLMLPRTTRRRLRAGAAISLLGLLAALAGFDPLGSLTPQVIFWLLAVLTLGAAAAAISMRSPVYTAIWFAVSLLGTSGLLIYQGASFLGVATIVVYAGAIVVIFLFVVMLAQPEGHATYDRISWGSIPKPIAVLVGAWLLATLSYLVVGSEQMQWLPAAAQVTDGELLHASHMAHLGGELFGRHLISVELAGTLLLVALVGAISIAIQGKRSAGSLARTVPATGANRIATPSAPSANVPSANVPPANVSPVSAREETAGE